MLQTRIIKKSNLLSLYKKIQKQSRLSHPDLPPTLAKASLGIIQPLRNALFGDILTPLPPIS